VPVVIIGAGACGLVAALAAHDAGAEVIVLERDSTAGGSTVMSGAMIPAPGSRWQKEAGIEDAPAGLVQDMIAATDGEVDITMATAVAEAAAPCLEWLADQHQIPLAAIDNWKGHGQSKARMVSVPSRTGEELHGALSAAAERVAIDVMTDALTTAIFHHGTGRVTGVRVERPDGSTDEFGCQSLILASGGFGGNPDMVAGNITGFVDAPYFGHEGNAGDGITWGEGLGAALRHMGAYQAHGGLATPHNIAITQDPMLTGGIQVNQDGERFMNEVEEVSGQAQIVLAQPGGTAWSIYGQAQFEAGMKVTRFREAEDAGAVRHAKDMEQLAALTGLPLGKLSETIAATIKSGEGDAADPFGRDFSLCPNLEAPFCAIRVTGAIYQTQGGLVVDGNARVLKKDDSPLPNLFAGGGAACGLSGAGGTGYLPGNGLLMAVVLGRLAGISAAEISRG
jgi:fumarate reductase flavoprotein subunit